MRALSWKEPYGSLMLPPYGKIETRARYTNVRGQVLICTSKVPYSENDVLGISRTNQACRIYESLGDIWHLYPLNGQAIAVGNLVDCRPMTKADEDACFVAYDPEFQRYCWIFEDVREIKPFPWKGAQGWKKVPQKIINQIVYL